MDYHHRALALAEEVKNPKMANFCNNTGITLYKQGNFREATDYLNPH
jgi:hypothetical protein